MGTPLKVGVIPCQQTSSIGLIPNLGDSLGVSDFTISRCFCSLTSLQVGIQPVPRRLKVLKEARNIC